jgi:hypothetical protein
MKVARRNIRRGSNCHRERPGVAGAERSKSGEASPGLADYRLLITDC